MALQRSRHSSPGFALLVLFLISGLPCCESLSRLRSDSASSSVKLNTTATRMNQSSARLSAWRAEEMQSSMKSTDAMMKGLAGQSPSGKTGAGEEMQCEIQRQYFPTPANCPKGNDFIPRAKLLGYMEQFRSVWTDFKTQLPGPTCCMGINHQFAIYATIKELNPLVIIESGAAAGRGTWLLRHTAGPNVPIFSIDPGDPVAMYPAQGWKDKSGGTTYFNGGNFQDLAMIRWDVHIPDPAIRARTLIILDDHQSSIERLKMLRNWGFRHVFYEDNYPFQVATSADKWTCEKFGTAMPRVFTNLLFGDAYSPNTVCGAVPPGWNFVLEKDRFGHKCQFLSLDQHAVNIKWFQEHLDSYFEFPSIFSRCTGLQGPNRAPLLPQDPAALAMMGFPTPEDELWNYGHLYPALMDLKVLDTTLGPRQINGQSVFSSEQAEGQAAALTNSAKIYQEIVNGQWP